MKSEGSLPCSQEPATRPCPEPDKFGPHPHILFFEDSFLCYPPIHAYVPKWSFPLRLSHSNFV
jgi:hypothetical protein